jgi:polygalacturonase
MAKLFTAIVLLLVGATVWLRTSNLFPRAATTPPINVMNYGATGNGTTDDTAAINNAIAALTSGSTLLFPCGTYLTTAQLTINTSNVTVDGGSCATIRNIASGTIMVLGPASGSPDYGPAVALSATASELAANFTTVSSLGVVAEDYVRIQQGGKDFSTDTAPGHDTGCDLGGCRTELLKVASVSGNTITVTTALHATYDPSVNAATAQKLLGPLTSITVKNITFDGGGSNVYGFRMAGVTDSAVTGVTSKNVQGSAIINYADFNVTWTNITITGAGSAACGSSAWFENQGNLSINGMIISNENPGTGGGCLGNGAFGFSLHGSANNTITNLTVDAAGAYGRPFKTISANYNTFNSLTVKNGVSFNNGISLEYYSSHNTFNNCVVNNNGANAGTGNGNAGINLFGNFNEYNTFNSCIVSGNGNLQVLVSNFDALHLGQDNYVTINGGTYTGTNTVLPVIAIIGANASMTSANINGPWGLSGLYLGSINACVNNNTFGAGTGSNVGIWSKSSTNIGSGNVLNGYSSNLTPGTCPAP